MSSEVPPAVESSTHPALRTEGSKTMLVVIEGLGLGMLGIDHLYAGNIGSFILKLCTLGGLGVWWLVDYVRVLANALSRSRKGVLGFHSWNENDTVDTPKILAAMLVALDVTLIIATLVIILIRSRGRGPASA